MKNMFIRKSRYKVAVQFDEAKNRKNREQAMNDKQRFTLTMMLMAQKSTTMWNMSVTDTDRRTKEHRQEWLTSKSANEKQKNTR